MTRLAVAVSLLSSFDFRLVGSVTQADWQRGTKLLRLPDDDDALWSRLQKEYATSEEDGGILLEDLPGRTRDVGVAMDASLLSNVLKGLIGGLAAVTEAADALRDLPSRVEEAEARSAAGGSRRPALKAPSKHRRAAAPDDAGRVPRCVFAGIRGMAGAGERAAAPSARDGHARHRTWRLALLPFLGRGDRGGGARDGATSGADAAD